MGWQDVSAIFNVVLTLVAIFQWWDKRSRRVAIENFVDATEHIAQRIQRLEKHATAQQGASNISENLRAILRALRGKTPLIRKRSKASRRRP